MSEVEYRLRNASEIVVYLFWLRASKVSLQRDGSLDHAGK